jgi:hypothetical protein
MIGLISLPRPIDAELFVRTTLYATPRVGWIWTFDPGFLLGFDLGVQFKLSADRNVRLPPGRDRGHAEQRRQPRRAGRELPPAPASPAHRLDSLAPEGA